MPRDYARGGTDDKGFVFIFPVTAPHAAQAINYNLQVYYGWNHIMPRTPSLDALRIFVAAARHLSFTEAANELCLTQSAVSHRIRGLEEELGIALFHRLTRRLELTPAGRELANKIGRAIADIDRSVADLDRSDHAGPLKVTMLPSVASLWLIPRLSRLYRRDPQLHVQVIADPKLLDLRAEGIDLAIRFCRAPTPGYVATRLMGDRVLPVCAPTLLRQHGPVQGLDQLLGMPLLHDSGTENDGSESDWQSWLTHHGRPDALCHAGPRFSEAGMLVNAAVLGLGVALARASLVADLIASEALVCPLGLVSPTAYTYYLLSLPEAAERPRIVALRDLLQHEAALTEGFIASLPSSLTTRRHDLRRSFAMA